MSIFSPVGNFFALDIGTSAIRLVQLKGGNEYSKSLVAYGSIDAKSNASKSDSAADQTDLAANIKKLIKESGVSSRNVVVGIPSDETFITVVDVPKVDKKELGQSIMYQAEQFIPIPKEEAQIDWALLGDSPKDPAMYEVLLASAHKGFAEKRLDLLESIGLNVVAIEPDSVAMSRALSPKLKEGEENKGVVIIDIGSRSTDIIVTLGGGVRLARSINQSSMNGFVTAAKQSLAIDDAQARQFVMKFGLDKTKLEGQIFRALEPTVGQLLAEINKSITFFKDRYQNAEITKIMVTGGAALLPGFPLHLANETKTRVEIGNSWQNVSYPTNKYNELVANSHSFAVAVGLAERAGNSHD